MKGQVVAYIRVSTEEQKTARQLDGIARDKTFIDKLSGKDTNRPALQEMLGFLRDGDHLYVDSMDRLARNIDDLRGMVKGLTARGVKVQFMKENLIFTGEDSPLSNLLLSVLGAVAEFEKSLINERQRAGIAIAKRNGVYKGRKPLTNDKVSIIRKRVADGESKAKIAVDMGICRQTLYKYLQT
jgi:DNA invertase Pin-like site-specific DNA recombinase